MYFIKMYIQPKQGTDKIRNVCGTNNEPTNLLKLRKSNG